MNSEPGSDAQGAESSAAECAAVDVDLRIDLFFEFLRKADAVEIGVFESMLRYWHAEYDRTAPGSRADVLIFASASRRAVLQHYAAMLREQRAGSPDAA